MVCFYLFKGINNDGHKFINFVLKNFKKTIVIGEKKSKYTKIIKNKRVILCTSTRKFIKDLAKIKRLVLNDRFFIGITGSSGKTSLKEILYSILKNMTQHINHRNLLTTILDYHLLL